jgi:tRNA(Ile)-lysidine synthase
MLLPIVRRTVRDRGLLDAGDHVLVACSGGPDSTVLLHVLHRLRNELGITLCAASIDHGLRPESADEVRQVGVFASSLGVPFVSAKVDVEPNGPSLQARARELRYDALRELAQRRSASAIAVGHTQSDQAETVLGRLLRGAGIRGLAGIEPKRSDGVVRPLIDCGRAAVREYAVAHELPFVDDPSNHQLEFERVRIRQEVLPVLEREDPRVVEHLSAIADEAAELQAWVARAAPPIALDETATVDIEGLLTLEPPVRLHWIREWIVARTGLAPSRAHLSQIGRLLQGSGEVLLGSGWSVSRAENRLTLEYRAHRRTRSHRP